MDKFTSTLVTIGLLVILTLSFGCSKKEEESSVANNNTQEPKKEETEKAKSKYPFPDNATPLGSGKITLSTPAGTSENGKKTLLYTSKDDLIVQIGLDAANFYGSKQSFIYVDKIFTETNQFGELAQSTVSLEEDMLKSGVHTVSVVQYENDDPKSGSVVGFAEAQYEVKEKK